MRLAARSTPLSWRSQALRRFSDDMPPSDKAVTEISFFFGFRSPELFSLGALLHLAHQWTVQGHYHWQRGPGPAHDTL